MSAVIANATAVVVLNVTLAKAVAMTVTMTILARDKTVAVVVAESTYQLRVGKIQSLYGVLTKEFKLGRLLSGLCHSKLCYRINIIAAKKVILSAIETRGKHSAAR